LTLECTHHGPLLNKIPCLFIEIGTTQEQWQDKKAGEIIAKTLSELQNFKKNNQIKTAIGIGGPHYSPNFNKIQLSDKSNIAISHIIPEYCLPVNESMLKEAISKTEESVDLILVDWKGCGNSESRQKVIGTIEKLSLSYERTENIKK
jgi:D-aminoacyl-tRNA deacylase